MLTNIYLPFRESLDKNFKAGTSRLATSKRNFPNGIVDVDELDLVQTTLTKRLYEDDEAAETNWKKGMEKKRQEDIFKQSLGWVS